MVEDRLALILENIKVWQDRLLFYIACGFGAGFVIGFLVSWMLVTWK